MNLKEKNTVKNRIFVLNTLMVVVILVIFFAVNITLVKMYAEIIEDEFRQSVIMMPPGKDLEEVLKNYTVHKNTFILLLILDGIICIGVLVLISQFFTHHLVRMITKPLDALEQGANRVKNGQLSQPVMYRGTKEFENACRTFNDMQTHILSEQEKNQKYESARIEMIAGISHDLRTPLTAVRGTIKGLIDGIASTPEQQKLFLETAYRRTGDMDVLLKRLFLFSKMETGHMPLSRKKMDMNFFAETYIQEKQTEHPEIIFSFAKAQKDAVADVDPEQMQRILDNLLENSIKYAEIDQLKIDVAVTVEDEYVHLLFIDNGNGVPEEKLCSIFEQFFRCDESRHEKEGSGLGLYIVRYLIEIMGGRVYAENQKGLAVHMLLPLTKEL